MHAMKIKVVMLSIKKKNASGWDEISTNAMSQFDFQYEKITCMLCFHFWKSCFLK